MESNGSAIPTYLQNPKHSIGRSGGMGDNSELRPLDDGMEVLENMVSRLVEVKFSSSIAQHDRRSQEKADVMEASLRSEIYGCRQYLTDQTVLINKCIDFNLSHQRALESQRTEVDGALALIKDDIHELRSEHEKFQGECSKCSKDIEALEGIVGGIQSDLQSFTERIRSFQEHMKLLGERIQRFEEPRPSLDSQPEIFVSGLEVVESLSKDVAQLYQSCETLKTQLDAFSPSNDTYFTGSNSLRSTGQDYVTLATEIDNAITRDRLRWSFKFLISSANFCVAVYRALRKHTSKICVDCVDISQPTTLTLLISMASSLFVLVAAFFFRSRLYFGEDVHLEERALFYDPYGI